MMDVFNDFKAFVENRVKADTGRQQHGTLAICFLPVPGES